jgi:hypothetical protein
MMNTHGIIGQPWQFVAAKDLKAIILPLTGGWVSGDPRGWPPTEALGSRFEVGDRIYLQEEWAHGFINGMGAVNLPARCFDQDEILDTQGLESWKEDDPCCAALAGIQPANTMTPELAQHWYEVTGVRIVQMHLSQLSRQDLIKSGIYTIDPDRAFDTVDAIMRRMVGRWNAAHPGHPWHGDHYVVVLDVEAIAK